MNIGQFFEQHRGTHAAKDVEIDPFDGLADLIRELATASEDVNRLISDVQIAHVRREMANMHANTRAIWDKLKQINIMAETMLRVTATHKERGVK